MTDTPARLNVLKTYKLFIDGKFPRTESGRSMAVQTQTGPVHLCLASRKDLRDAVEAARKAQPGWAGATAYNRGQVLYRMAEMLEGKKREFVEAIGDGAKARSNGGTKARRHGGSKGKRTAEDEVTTAIDRLVSYAGWADKYAQVLGCNNPVAGPYYNFTIPEPTGVIGVIAPDAFPLLALVSLMAPVLCAGNTVIALGSSASPIPAAILGEVCATSDVPAGVVNILTGQRSELLPHFAGHRDIDGLHAGGLSDEESALLRGGIAENLKRVRTWGPGSPDWFDAAACQSPWRIEPFVEMKTVWHPSAV